MIDEGDSAFVASEVYAIETPAVPCVEVLGGFRLADKRLLMFLDPRPMVASRTYYHLLILGDVSVVQYLTVGI